MQLSGSGMRMRSSSTSTSSALHGARERHDYVTKLLGSGIEMRFPLGHTERGMHAMLSMHSMAVTCAWCSQTSKCMKCKSCMPYPYAQRTRGNH